MEDNWIYIGLFLDDKSKETIMMHLQLIGIDIPEDWRMYMHHMTLCFNKHDESSETFYQYYHALLDCTVNVIVKSIGISDDIIALGVKTILPCQNKIPHITVAAKPDCPPVNSNYIDEWESLNPFEISGTISMFVKKPRACQSDINLKESTGYFSYLPAVIND